jgi:DNA polymerase-3 subunit alpha
VPQIKKALKIWFAGGFDFLGTTRAQYFHDDGDGITFTKSDRYGANFKKMRILSSKFI